MPILSIKAYLYAALLAAIVGSGFYIKHVFDDRAQLREDLKASNLSRDTAIAAGMQYQKYVEDQAEMLRKAQLDLGVKLDENNVLRASLASGQRVRIKATCPSVPAATTNTSDTNTYAELDSKTGFDILDLREGIIKIESNYASCLDQLALDRKKPLTK